MACQKCGEWVFLEISNFCPACEDYLGFEDLAKGGR